MASLDEPYLVTSYGISPDQPRSASKGEDERFKLGVTSVIYRESSKASKTGKQQSRRAIAVNTVQGNGIHLVDLSDQSPLSAFTVSPSTVFTCKAISISSDAAIPSSLAIQSAVSASASTSAAGGGASSTFKGRSRKTFVGLEQNGEYQLCCWTEVEDADGTAMGDAVKVSKTVTSPVIAIASLDRSVLAYDASGRVTQYDQEVREIATLSLGFEKSRISRIEPVQADHLLDSEGQPVVLGTGSVYRASVLIFEDTSAVVDKKASPKKASKKRQSVSGQTELQSTTQNQKVHIVYLRASGRTIVEAGRALIPAESVIDCVQLREGKFVVLDLAGQLKTCQVDQSPLVYVRPSDPLAITSHVLSFLSSTEQSIHIRTDVLNIRHARISPVSPSQATTSPSSCFLLAAPRSDPAGTVDISMWDANLGLALAHQVLALPTLLEREGTNSLSIQPLPGGLVGLAYTPTPDMTGLDTQAQLAKRSTLHAMSVTAPVQMNLASVVGKRALTQLYIAEPASSAASSTKSGAVDGTEEDDIVAKLEQLLASDSPTRDVEAAEETFAAWLKPAGEESQGRHSLKKRMSSLSAKQARRLLRLAVPDKLDDPVASRIAHDLIAAKKVSDSSIKEGLTFNLLERRNWGLVSAALLACEDIPESTLVSILAVFLGPDARKAGSKLSLEKVLRNVIRVPTSPSTLRTCLKKQLNAEEVKAILRVLDNWLAADSKQTAIDGPISSASPGTVYIIPFLQAILDAHLVTILQTEALHPLVQSVSAHLLDAISFSASIQNLQGPLEAFSKAHKQEKARQIAMKKAHSKKAQYESKAWSAKKALQENQLLLGDYATETFQL